MRNLLSAMGRFLTELRRRKVYQVALAYVVVGFMVIEAADLTLVRLGLPPWTVTLVVVLVGLGFPIALVLAWALEVTPEGVRVDTAEETPAEEEAPAPRSSVPSLWAGASILALLLVGAWWLFGGLGPAEQASDAGAEIQDRSIAVLPFEVSGAGAEEWRDGMVTMLSMNLDGAAGLRAIPDRRIFAAAEQADSIPPGAMQPGSMPAGTEGSALAIARQTGARYAIIGSAVQLGGDLRLGAEVRETASGERLGQVEVRGEPERVTGLADELTRKVLGVLLEGSEESMPTVDLESLTTESLPALKSYLEGERRFRAGDYKAALKNFETAIKQDSTFALAYHRLAGSKIWMGRFEGIPLLIQRGYELSDRLPLRERRKMWASHSWNVRFRALVARDSLRHFTEIYPEDPRMWTSLAELLFHGNVPGGWPEAERAFLKIMQLDPEMAMVHHHLVDLAFSLRRDSALAAERIAAHPEGIYRKTYQLALELVFGTDKQREEAFELLDNVASSVPYLVMRDAIAHPVDQKLQTEVLTALREQADPYSSDYELYTWHLAKNRFERGQIGEAMSILQQEEVDRTEGACILALSRSLGYSIPSSLERSYLKPVQTGVEEGTPWWRERRLLCAGIYLIEEGRDDQIDAFMDRLQERGKSADSPGPAKLQAEYNELQGYRLLRRGDAENAERLWSSSKRPFWPWGALWRGDLYRELGKMEKAKDWYVAAWDLPVAHERLGQIYEEIGRPEDAADAYERFIEAWEQADRELQDRVKQAQTRLSALRKENAAE